MDSTRDRGPLDAVADEEDGSDLVEVTDCSSAGTKMTDRMLDAVEFSPSWSLESPLTDPTLTTDPASFPSSSSPSDDEDEDDGDRRRLSFATWLTFAAADVLVTGSAGWPSSSSSESSRG